MRLDEPRWWHAPAGRRDLAARLLSPASRLYGALVEARFHRATPYRSPLPVICIGNFTAGGTGKTPLAIHVLEHLEGSGRRPVCLTRGYGGRKAGPHWVDAGRDTAADVGDEPLLVARRGRVVVARNRADGAKLIEAADPAAGAIVMDDGLQNPGLAKDLVIAVVDGARGIGNGEIIPAGPLRAPLAFQLGLVDCIVVNGATTEEGSILDRMKRRFPGPVLATTAVPRDDVSWLADAPVVAFAGIANPDRFFRMLETLDARVVGKVRFPDHHNFSERDAADLLRRADGLEAVLVTTEKDAARLAGATATCAELRERSRTLPIRLALDERDQNRLHNLIDAAVKERTAEKRGD